MSPRRHPAADDVDDRRTTGPPPPGRTLFRRAVIVTIVAVLVAGAWWFLRARAYRPLRLSAPAIEGTDAKARGTEGAGDRASRGGQMGSLWHGAIHVHSRRSDGASTVEAIAREAEAAGLDFVILNDHSADLLAQGPLRPGWYGDVLVIPAEEVSTRDGHLLALGASPHRYALAPGAAAAVRDIEELGGWAMVAHPGSADDPWRGSWTTVAGVEAYNLAGLWSRASLRERTGIVFGFLANPSYGAVRLTARPPDGLTVFDRITALGAGRERGDAGRLGGVGRPLATVGGTDAHGPPAGVPFLGTPGYREVFAAVRLHVWSTSPPRPGEAGERRQAARLLRALRRGRAATELAAAGELPVFRWSARRPPAERRPVISGGHAAWERGPWTLEAEVDAEGPYRLVLLRDGRAVDASEGGPLRHVAQDPGTYRVEMYRLVGPPGGGRTGAVPWLVSNPIYVWPTADWHGSRLHPVGPPPAPPVLEELVATPRWNAESDGSAGSSLGPGAQGLVWSFGLPAEGRGDAFAAVAWRPAGEADWSDRRGLVLGLGSERTMRVRVELGTRAGSGEERRWRWSAKVTPQGPPVGVPWGRWSPAAPGTGESPAPRGRRGTGGSPSLEDLRRVTGLYLVVTPEMFRPGTRERVRVETVGPY